MRPFGFFPVFWHTEAQQDEKITAQLGNVDFHAVLLLVESFLEGQNCCFCASVQWNAGRKQNGLNLKFLKKNFNLTSDAHYFEPISNKDCDFIMIFFFQIPFSYCKFVMPRPLK